MRTTCRRSSRRSRRRRESQCRAVPSRFLVVILQQGPSSLPENLYMVWLASDRPADFDAVRDSYLAAAVAVDGLFVPGGEAWRAAWRRDPALRLYGPDGFHPSTVGSYLVALAMLEEIAGRSSTSVPDLGLGIPATTRALLAEAAHEATDAFGRR